MAINGFDLFQECLEHPEKLIDDFYTTDQLIITENSEQAPTGAMQTWRKVLDRITVAEVAFSDGDNDQLDKQILALDKILIEGSDAQLLEFTSFFNVLGVSYTIYKKLNKQERVEFLKEVFLRYLDKRYYIYSMHGYTPTTLQVKKDISTSRSKGNMGNQKARKMLAEAGYKEDESILNKRKRFSIITSQKQRSLQEMREIGANCYQKWSQQHQGKKADVVFVDSNGNYYICEMKHLKETGGLQDKQISELIALIDNQGDEGISYVAYLDGIYFNKFIASRLDQNKVKPSTGKISKQKENIEKCLANNPSNYFLNTHGFQKLICTL